MSGKSPAWDYQLPNQEERTLRRHMSGADDPGNDQAVSIADMHRLVLLTGFKDRLKPSCLGFRV